MWLTLVPLQTTQRVEYTLDNLFPEEVCNCTGINLLSESFKTLTLG